MSEEPHVVVRPEELAAVDSKRFPHAVAIEEAMVKRADLRISLVDEAAVDPDLRHFD